MLKCRGSNGEGEGGMQGKVQQEREEEKQREGRRDTLLLKKQTLTYHLLFCSYLI